MCIRDRESGTGCVHTAPGHGVEDFEVCKKYNFIDIVVPVDEKGYMTADAGMFEGLSTMVTLQEPERVEQVLNEVYPNVIICCLLYTSRCV